MLSSFTVRLMLVAVLAMTFCVTGQLFDGYDEYRQVKTYSTYINEKLEKQRFDNKLLKKELNYQKNRDAHYGKIARDELKMCYPDEQVYLVKLP